MLIQPNSFPLRAFSLYDHTQTETDRQTDTHTYIYTHTHTERERERERDRDRGTNYIIIRFDSISIQTDGPKTDGHSSTLPW